MRTILTALSLSALLLLGCAGLKDVQEDFPPDVESPPRPDFDDTGRESPVESPSDDSAEPVWTRHEFNFDELEASIIDSHYPELSFTVDEGLHMVVYPASSIARSLPNCLYVTSDPGNPGSDAAFTLSFPRPVRNLRFFTTGDTTAGEVAGVDLTLESGETYVTALIADGNASSAELVDLSAYAEITSLRVYNISDPSGLAYDDLSFEMRDP